MQKCIRFTLIAVILATLPALISASGAQAEPASLPSAADSPYDLINAVNALRASNGLAPYSVNSILMYTAQSHAEFMAATGNVSHTGAGGSSVTSRLLAAGYPLAGDLSLGGFRAENITSGSEGMSAQAAVNSWTGDAPHLNTMLSPNLSEIGAGVAVTDGRVYYVIDCALPKTGGASGAPNPAGGDGSIVPAGEAPIPRAVVSTPNSNGDVIHEVKMGQSLWQIAIAYGVKIDDIRRLNNLVGNNIYPGDKLFIKRGVELPTVTPADTLAVTTIVAPATIIPPNFTAPPATASAAPTVVITPGISYDNNTIMGVVIGIVALSLLGGGIFTWLGSSKKA